MAICSELSIGRLDMEHRGSVGASMENWEVDLSLPQHTVSLYVRGRLTVQREPSDWLQAGKGRMGRTLQRMRVAGVLALRAWQWQERQQGRRSRLDFKDREGLQLEFWLSHLLAGNGGEIKISSVALGQRCLRYVVERILFFERWNSI